MNTYQRCIILLFTCAIYIGLRLVDAVDMPIVRNRINDLLKEVENSLKES